MNYRKLGKTGFQISEVSLGTWQAGGKWGQSFDQKLAEDTIHQALDLGVNFIDTADVYSDGQSEAAVAKVVKSRSEEIYVATKCGRRTQPHVNEEYTPERLRGFVEDSLKNTGFDTLDLIQLHCPPTQVYYRPEIFELFELLQQEGKIRHLGVSVEKVEEAIKAIEYPNVTTVQIIFNMFRHRPADLFFQLAQQKEVGIIVRVPLASGLLSGKFGKDTQFGQEDHRTFNRQGQAFDKGETFSGIDYELGLEAVEELKALFPSDQSLAAWAIRWVLMFDQVSTVIPGASRPQQVLDNVQASGLSALSQEQMKGVQRIYEEKIKGQVHQVW
ncbi:MAG: aldo/keto reductase [Candidatus Cyclobacteriaceae bacterium M3_2C_046]